ncbi:MAG: hypothetical protein AAGO57_00945 [Pseudomonadota bacterium]
MARISSFIFLLLTLTLLFGIAATILNDHADIWGRQPGVGPWYWLAFWPRLVTYFVLFLSFPFLARALANDPRRGLSLWLAWALSGIAIASFEWAHLTIVADPYITPSLKRHSPDTMASFAPGWKMAEIYLGRDYPFYTWGSVIFAEMIGIIFVCGAVANYLFAIRHRRIWLGVLAPVVSVVGLHLYSLAAPWAFTIDFDHFIGDGLLGVTIFNVGGFPQNLLTYGGFTGPAVWVSLMALANVFFAWRWTKG